MFVRAKQDSGFYWTTGVKRLLPAKRFRRLARSRMDMVAELGRAAVPGSLKPRPESAKTQFVLGTVSVLTIGRYLGCKQKQRTRKRPVRPPVRY